MTQAKTQHIIPVDLPKSKFNQIMNLAYRHKIIGQGVTRSDFKFHKNFVIKNKYSTWNDKIIFGA